MTVEPHTEAACFLLAREQQNVETVAIFSVDGEPVSKSRPRFTNVKSTRAYTPERTQAAEETVAWTFRASAPRHRLDSESAFGVFAIFFAGTRQRRDVDNMLKLICDGLTGVAWQDDSQVLEVSGRRGTDMAQNARTEIWIYRVGPLPPPPSAPCAYCGEPFRTYASWASNPKGKKYCSQACKAAAVRAARKSICPQCGEVFTNPTSHSRKYCSDTCQTAAETATWNCVQCGRSVTMPKSWRRQHELCADVECHRVYWNARRKSAAKGTCSTCGGPTSKKTYANCRACAPYVRAAGHG